MLPTLKKLRAQTIELTQAKLRRNTKARSILRGSNDFIIHEGQSTSIERADGTREDISLKPHSAMHESKISEFRSFELAVYEREIEKIVDQFARSMNDQIISEMNSVTDKTGQKIDGASRDFEMAMLDALEMLPASEEADDFPTMVVSPAIADRVEELQKAPKRREVENRLTEIQKKKWLERDAAKARRKLVG